MRILILKPVIAGGRACSPGEIVDLREGEALFLLNAGKATLPPADEPESAAADPPERATQPIPRRRRP